MPLDEKREKIRLKNALNLEIKRIAL